MAAHPVDDAIWSRSNPSDVSIDTANSAEIIAGFHITEGLTYAFERSDPFGLIDTPSHVSDEDDMSWYDRSAFLDSFTDSSKSDTLLVVMMSPTILQVNPSSLIFVLANVNPKHRTFDADYYTV